LLNWFKRQFLDNAPLLHRLHVMSLIQNNVVRQFVFQTAYCASLR